MDDRFQDICAGILAELHAHKEEIEGGMLNWFSIKVMLRRDNLQATWMSEENVILQTNGQNGHRPAMKVTVR